MTVAAVVPVKDLAAAKQRLAGVLPAALRRELMLAMLGDVLEALARVPALPVVVATADSAAAALALRMGAAVSGADAAVSHSAAVAAAASALARDGAAMLTVPADIPLIAPEDITRLLAARETPGFAIVPARDGLGSNAVLVSPADAVPLGFGGASYGRHIAAARARGIVPKTLVLPRIGLDIDTAVDLSAFLAAPSRTRTRALLERHGIAPLAEASA